MKKALRLMSAAVALAFSATTIQAIPIQVDFSFNGGDAAVAFGTFTYDDSLQGNVLSYADLSAFSLNVPPALIFDLAFLNSGNFTDFYYLAFDTNSNMFLQTSIQGFDTILMAAIQNPDTFDAGYLLIGDDSSGIVGLFPDNQIAGFWDSIVIRITSVPEPGTLLLMAIGLASMAFTGRKRRAPAPVPAG